VSAPASERTALLVENLLRRAEVSGHRQVVGIVGAPGTGKSTFAEHVLGLLPAGSGVIVPMDGFHLASSIIDGTPLRDRRGAIDTFDAAGYLSLLQRIRSHSHEIVYAPAYRRGLEDPIAASIAVTPAHRFVLTEGNYLLSDEQPWAQLRDLFDETWFVDTPNDIRLARLIERHVKFGMSPDAAAAWALGSDETNARYVQSTRPNADHLIDWL
jgi:pantothenate kinase